MAKQFYKTKEKKKNNTLVNVINGGLSDLKDEIKNMSEYEKESEKPDQILGNYCILCTDKKKKRVKQIYKSLVDII